MAEEYSFFTHINLQDSIGGESGIRTHGRVSPTHAFQACSFSHSDISPFSRSRGLEPLRYEQGGHSGWAPAYREPRATSTACRMVAAKRAFSCRMSSSV